MFAQSRPSGQPTNSAWFRERVRSLVPGLARLFPAGEVAVLRLHGPIVGGGSGVISASPRLVKLLERAGVEVSETRAGRLKGMGAPWREESPEEHDKEQQVIEAFYASFVRRVAAGRGLSEERVRELATG